VRFHDLAEPNLPGFDLLPPIPDEAEPAADPEHAMDLRQSCVPVEPMECLSDRDRVDRGIGQRDRLGRPAYDLDPWQRLLDPTPHAGCGLDRDDPCAGRGKEPGQLAGAGS
jgi:hypothetical protein